MSSIENVEFVNYLDNDYSNVKFNYSSKEIIAEEIFASKQKYGNIFKLGELDDLRMTKNERVRYLPIEFKRPNDTISKFNFVFDGQVLGSGAKRPPYKVGESNETEQFKYLSIIFRRFSKEMLMENSLVSEKNINLIYASCQKNCQVLDIINDDFSKCLQSLLDKKGNLVLKGVKQKSNFVSIKQVEYQDKKANQLIDCDTPLYRIRLMADYKTGKIGRFYGNNFIPTVYDARTANSTLGIPPKEAMINHDGKKITQEKVSLNKFNVEKYITWGSLVRGRIYLGTVIFSQQGVSLDLHFSRLEIRRKKTKEPTNQHLDQVSPDLIMGAVNCAENDNDSDLDNLNDSDEKYDNKSDDKFNEKNNSENQSNIPSFDLSNLNLKVSSSDETLTNNELENEIANE